MARGRKEESETERGQYDVGKERRCNCAAGLPKPNRQSEARRSTDHGHGKTVRHNAQLRIVLHIPFSFD